VIGGVADAAEEEVLKVVAVGVVIQPRGKGRDPKLIVASRAVEGLNALEARRREYSVSGAVITRVPTLAVAEVSELVLVMKMPANPPEPVTPAGMRATELADGTLI
jgi:hypothetical protein